MATYSFGVASTLTTAYGLIQNFQVTHSGQIAELKNEDGETIDYDTYDEIYEATCDLIHDITVPPPAVGVTITTTGSRAGKYMVISIDASEDNGSHKKLSVKLKRWVSGALPA